MKLQGLMQNPYAWAVLSICTIFALIFAVYTWIVGKKKKELSCFNNTFEIVKAGKSLVPKLGLSYDGKIINDLAITKYAIWNSGNEVLNWSDIVGASPLQIVSNDNALILDVLILVQSDETNMFKIIEKTDNCAKVSFDYMNVNDGIILQILHTGEIANLNVECRIKGGKKLKNLNHNVKKRNNKIKRTKKRLVILLGIDVFFSCVMSALIILNEIGIISRETLKGILIYEGVSKAFLVVLLLILVVVMVGTYWILLKKVFYLGIPMKLRKNMEYDDFGNILATENQ